MRLPKRIRQAPGRYLLLAAGLVAGTIGVTPVSAAPAPSSASYQGAPLAITQLARAKSFHDLPSVAGAPVATARATRQHKVSTASGTGAGAPVVSPASAASRAGASVLHNFAGLNDAQQAAVYGGEVTPPDQGLCVGPDPTRANAMSVFEMVNVALIETTTSGTAVGPVVSLPTFFHDANAFSDPKCFYDKTTSTFFFTIISCHVCGPPGTADSAVDIAVLNTHGFIVYQGQTNQGGTVFGDQPHVGYDNNNLYISTDQFGASSYDGALLIAINKAQLVAETLPSATAYGPVSLGGVPVITLQPGVSPGASTEYLLNSFPYDQYGNNNAISNLLGLWTFSGITLTGKLITSETYAFPVPARSTGDGSVTLVGPHNIPVQSEPFLNPDDSRMQQVQVRAGSGGPQLWASLPSAVNLSGDPSARDGVAWFEIAPTTGKIMKQGYIAQAGDYLLYPAIWATGTQVTVSYTVTSATLNPSAAFSVFNPASPGSPAISIASAGTGPHKSFAGPLFNRPRWGDYSATTPDPSGHGMWMATELIPTPPSGQYDNWGTQVFEVTS